MKTWNEIWIFLLGFQGLVTHIFHLELLDFALRFHWMSSLNYPKILKQKVTTSRYRKG